jgi:hypothetical protein
MQTWNAKSEETRSEERESEEGEEERKKAMILFKLVFILRDTTYPYLEQR